MATIQELRSELEHEAKTTRRFLERVPEDKFDWKPHEKSLSAGQLALHMAKFPAGIVDMATKNPCPMPDFGSGFEEAQSREELLSTFDDSIRRAQHGFDSLSDDQLGDAWTMVADDTELISMPRGLFIRNVLLNHLYHHRGQLGVYLRMLGAEVPWAYGPSGDETPPEFEKIREIMAAKAG